MKYPSVTIQGLTLFDRPVSDWQTEKEPGTPFGQEQTFNFLEIQPYHE